MSINTGTSTNINIRVDTKVKTQAQDLFADLGLDMTTAINIFLRKAIQKNGIPFEIVKENEQEKKIRQFGKYKGKMWESKDHDWFEPLEDFKEYM